MKNDMGKKAADAEKKGRTGYIPYEKPRVEKVNLFADQVLGEPSCARSCGPSCYAIAA